CHSRRSKSRRRAAAPPWVSHRVFFPVRVIGMTGTKGLHYVAVVLAARVLVSYQQGYGGACSNPFIKPRKNLHRVRFTSLRHMTRGSRSASVELALNISRLERQTRRTTVNHTTDSWAVRFAKVGDTKKRAKSTTCHDSTAGFTGAWEKSRLSHRRRRYCIRRSSMSSKPLE